MPNKTKPPIDKARMALSRRVAAPIKRLHALALTLRDRDLTDDELAIAGRVAEQIRADFHTLRKSAAASL